MRLCVYVAVVLIVSVYVTVAFEDITNMEDDDFAEFEQFEADDEQESEVINGEQSKVNGKEQVKQKLPTGSKEQYLVSDDLEEDTTVEDEDSEFEHFQDPEEFEGYSDTVPTNNEQPKITISKMNITVRARWESYWLEGIVCCILAVYGVFFVIGKSKNTSIANNLLSIHGNLLEDNFASVGESEDNGGWHREAEHMFTLWCSGRTCCEGMLLTLKLIKRQDLVSVIWNMFRGSVDTLHVRVELAKDGDPFVLCIAPRKVGTKLVKEMQDLSTYCMERRSWTPCEALSVWSECGDAASAVLDTRVSATLQKYYSQLQYLHISDQFSGPKQIEGEAPQTKLPETQRVLMMGINIESESAIEDIKPLLQMVFYLIDKLKRLKLNKEALTKVERNRQKVEAAFIRTTHQARQEQAAARREEKRKQEKEKILAEDDPEKQRRWELKEQKRQMKKKTPKMKQLKVKAL